MNELILACLIILPVFEAGVAHMVAVKLKFLQLSARPVSEKYFGSNKTWRGFLLMPVFTVLFSLLHGLPEKSGWVLGFAYVLAELPNSYFKRTMGIAPGGESKTYKWLFRLIDQSDSVMGCGLGAWLFLDTSFVSVIYILIIGTAVHIATNSLLYSLKLRKTKF
jgi:hypothetical protein